MAGRPGCPGPGASRAFWLQTPAVKASFHGSEGSCALPRAPSCPHPGLGTTSGWEAAGRCLAHRVVSPTHSLSCSPCRRGRECPCPVAKRRSTPASKSGDGIISCVFSKFRPRRQGLLRTIKMRKKVPGGNYHWSFHSSKVKANSALGRGGGAMRSPRFPNLPPFWPLPHPKKSPQN